jgi:predicted CopG family antitoxin
MAQMLTKRIPVSEDRWKELGKIKEAGQTYDDLLGEMLRAYNRRDLAARMDAAEKGKGNWTNLEDI